jgi:hypothetical protein
MSGDKYYDDYHNMQTAFIRAIYRAIGHPLPEPAPAPTPEPTLEPPVDPIDKAEAEYQALVATFHRLRPRNGWRISTTNRDEVVYQCSVPIDGAKEAPYCVSVLYPVPLKRFVDYLTREAEELEKQRWRGVSRDYPTNQRYQPVPPDYIARELDKQGYYFIPGAFLAIKRTDRWRVE